jgi:hypothetical protein
MVKKQSLYDYWQENIQNNLKIISALIFLILSKVLAIVFLGMRLGLDWLLILIILEIALEPFIIIWMRIIFTGEVSASKIEADILKAQLEYEREIAEYRIQIASKTGEVVRAVKSNKDWNDANKGLNGPNIE